MKKLITSIAAVSLGALGLAGCNSSTTATMDQIVAAAQKAAVVGCAVMPTAASIAKLVTAANAGAAATEAIAATIAAEVCAGVAASTAASTTVKGTLVPAPIVVHGVTVEFQPVSK